MSRPSDYTLGTRLHALRKELQAAEVENARVCAGMTTTPSAASPARQYMIELIDILLDAAPDKFLNNDRNYDRNPEDDR